MTVSRYRESRTLVRKLQRLPGERKEDFRRKIGLLRGQHDRFNATVSELCQWLMAIRPDSVKSGEDARLFWNSFLQPLDYEGTLDESDCDTFRVVIFKVALNWAPGKELDPFNPSDALIQSVRYVGERPLTQTALKLFDRLREKSPSHLLILLKVAAEIVLVRYWRSVENWERGHAAWEKEKSEWESEHPELTPEVINTYTQLYKSLEVRRKRLRICTLERIQDSALACEFNGVRIRGKMHGPLCEKYQDFLNDSGKDKKRNETHFDKNAQKYLRLRNRRPGRARSVLLEEFFKSNPKAQAWFGQTWVRYLETVGINEDTLVQQYNGRLPHCTRLRGDTECPWNVHTELCTQYAGLLKPLNDETKRLEALYREWRWRYLSGPKKPSFVYPSSRGKSTAKIFGSSYYEIDWTASRLRLRLDDASDEEWLEFGFDPWPADYTPQPKDAAITSVHLNFVGTHGRAGFRFNAPAKVSRFSIPQDELDLLRSREYPRDSQDEEFLDAARKILMDSLDEPNRPLKFLAVDLGTDSACAALFEGTEFVRAIPLRIVKLDRLMSKAPKGKKDPKKGLGLNKKHVGRHLEAISQGATAIAQARTKTSHELDATIETLRRHDMTGLSRHVNWMIRDWARLNARQIADVAECSGAELIVLESLRGFKAPGYDSSNIDKKRTKAFFAYGTVRRKLKEKAVERGMRVLPTPYFYSSQVCCECGERQKDVKLWRKNKRAGRFVCEFEGCKLYSKETDNKSMKGRGGLPGIDGDENAARVLGRVFLGEIRLPQSADSYTLGVGS